MPATIFRGRHAVAIESDHLRVTVLREGGHIAEIFDKQAGVSPLWIPPWPSIEPSSYELSKHPEYGADAEAKLLAGIMGHNLCLDFFGGPSAEEAAAGLTVHGEGSVVPYEITDRAGIVVSKAHLPLAQLNFERSIELRDRGLKIRESVGESRRVGSSYRMDGACNPRSAIYREGNNAAAGFRNPLQGLRGRFRS